MSLSRADIYLERHEMDALLRSIDRTNRNGRRDYALFALMFNSVARVQEVLDLRVRDVRFDTPVQVRLLGKGKKSRICPLWPVTSKLLTGPIAEATRYSDDRAEERLFVNARGGPLALRCSLPLAPVCQKGNAGCADAARQEAAPSLLTTQYGNRLVQGRRQLRHH
jgi:integrase